LADSERTQASILEHLVEMRDSYKILGKKNLKRRQHMGELGIDGTPIYYIILPSWEYNIKVKLFLSHTTLQCFLLCYMKDGAELSTVNGDVKLPRSQGSYLCDSDDREPLVRAYHPDAMFSITSACPPRPRHSSTAPPK
jgi:hypothetical protein